VRARPDAKAARAQSSMPSITALHRELPAAAALAARGARLAALSVGHIDWAAADVRAYAPAWAHLAALDAGGLSELDLDVAGAWWAGGVDAGVDAWVGGGAGEDRVRPLPLGDLLARVAAAAPSLARLSVAGMLPGAVRGALSQGRPQRCARRGCCPAGPACGPQRAPVVLDSRCSASLRAVVRHG